MHHLQVSTQLTGHAAVSPACQSTDTEFDWFTFGERLSGQTALCLLIPDQGATWPTHPEVNWSLRERATVPVATPKIKLLPSVCVAGADGGFQATWDGWDAAPTGGLQTPPPEGRWSLLAQKTSRKWQFVTNSMRRVPGINKNRLTGF